MMVVSFKDLGLSNTREMFARAMKEGYAVPAYNFNNMEQLQAIIMGCVESQSPVILQVSKGAREYANGTLLRHMAMGAVEYARELGGKIPIVLHLDHGDSFELAKNCIDNGFSSVMFDGSALPYEENIRITKQVVEYAHPRDVPVEAELGRLAGVEESVSSDKTHYTDPSQVQDFVKRTGCDSLAIAIGTSHGAYKFKLKPGEPLPPLRFDILEEVKKRLPNFPIVLHGSSSVLKTYVDMIDKYGGKLEGAVGIPEEQLRKAATMHVAKINIDTDGRLVMTAMIRKTLFENPKEFDPRKYLGPAREELKKMIVAKNKNVLGSAGRYK
jgi:fructose-bisphosphate aldolase class II